METKRAFEVDDLFRFEYVSESKLSGNGKQAVYVLMRTDQSKNQEFSNLWLINLETQRTIQLTHGDWEDYAPAWSPDGNSIAFLSRRDGKPQIYFLSLDGGEARKITSLPQGCSGSLLWSPDGSQIVFCAGSSTPQDLSQPYRVTRAVYRVDGVGYVENFVKQIYVLDVENEKTIQLTFDEWNHTPTSWSPDGNHILHLASLNPDSISLSASIKSINLKGEVQIILSSDWGILSNAVWINNHQIAFCGVPTGNLLGTKGDLWILDIENGIPECRSASIPNGINGHFHDDLPNYWSFSAAPILPSSDGSNAIVCVQQGGEIHLVQINLFGEENIRTVASGKRFCFPFNRTDTQVLFGVSAFFDPTQLMMLNLENEKERQLTQLNQTLLNQIQFPEIKNFHFKSIDDVSVEAWLLLPQGQAPFPTVLHIHGGPHYAYGNAFHFDFLTLTGAGYAVLVVNYRGSTGYGNEFATATHADWGNLDYQDLMAGVDEAIRQGISDANRLGCCGVSGGGFLSCWIVGHTDRFKVAIPENPVTNFVSFYGTSDVGPVFTVREMGGKPHEVPETYKRCSPITYAHLCKTPTLLVVGENDHRCPPEQAEQFYATLKANGCVTEMLRLPNSSHDGASIGSFASRKIHNEILLEWMNKYLLEK